MADPMKFNASTDPALSEVELSEAQIKRAMLLHDAVNNDTDAAADEIIALRAALEQHAEALRAAKLAGWEAGRKAAAAIVEDAADEAAGEMHNGLEETPPSESTVRFFEAMCEHHSIAADNIRAMSAPTPSQLDEIR